MIADHLWDPDSATSWTPVTRNLSVAHLHDSNFIGCHFGTSLYSGTTFTAVARFDGATFANESHRPFWPPPQDDDSAT